MKKTTLVSLVLLICICFTSCGNEYFNAKYITKPYSDGTKGYLEFTKEGEVFLTDGGWDLVGTYRQVEKKVYDLHFDGGVLVGNVRYTATIKGEVLTLQRYGQDKEFLFYLEK